VDARSKDFYFSIRKSFLNLDETQGSAAPIAQLEAGAVFSASTFPTKNKTFQLGIPRESWMSSPIFSAVLF